MFATYDLDAIVAEVMNDNSFLSAAQIVKRVLETGYDDENLSAAVHASLKRLCREGRFTRIDSEDQRTRRYQVKKELCLC